MKDQPLAKVAVVVEGQGVASHQLLALHGALVRKDVEGHLLARCFVRLSHPLVDFTLLVAFPAELEEAHLFIAPGAVFIELQEFGLHLHVRPRHNQANHGATIPTRGKLLGEEVEPHLRLSGLVVEEHTTGHRESRGLVIQPLPSKAVRELGRVCRHILQQQPLAIPVEDILVASDHVQGLNEIGSVALCLDGQRGGPRFGNLNYV